MEPRSRDQPCSLLEVGVFSTSDSPDAASCAVYDSGKPGRQPTRDDVTHGHEMVRPSDETGINEIHVAPDGIVNAAPEPEVSL